MEGDKKKNNDEQEKEDRAATKRQEMRGTKVVSKYRVAVKDTSNEGEGRLARNEAQAVMETGFCKEQARKTQGRMHKNTKRRKERKKLTKQ